MNPVLIIAAMKFEVEKISGALNHRVRLDKAAFPYYEGTIAGLPVAVCSSGVGKINAAAATAAMIERLEPQLVINTGCAGAYYNSGLAVGDLAVAGEEILGDEGVATSTGWMDLAGMNLSSLTVNNHRYYNEIPLTDEITGKALDFARSRGIRIVSGRFITVSTCSGSLEIGNELARRCNGIAENMEGAAVALTCLRYGINCLEIRGISNMVDERNMDNWNISLALDKAQDFVLKYLEYLGGVIG